MNKVREMEQLSGAEINKAKVRGNGTVIYFHQQ